MEFHQQEENQQKAQSHQVNTKEVQKMVEFLKQNQATEIQAYGVVKIVLMVAKLIIPYYLTELALIVVHLHLVLRNYTMKTSTLKVDHLLSWSIPSVLAKCTHFQQEQDVNPGIIEN